MVEGIGCDYKRDEAWQFTIDYLLDVIDRLSRCRFCLAQVDRLVCGVSADSIRVISNWSR
jgi:hypothetical protein